MYRFFKVILSFTLIAGIGIIILQLLFPLPDISNRPYSKALSVNTQTQLSKIFLKKQNIHPNQTGVTPLFNGNDAYASRILLAQQAQQSIDVQYYIWHDDISGRLLLKALYDAAKRGVRVRLLIDDNGIHGLDDSLTALNAIKNFEVRIFNPSMVRSPKIVGFSFDPLRMNRRMHNKSFIVDGTAAIIGGRNIGDEYFKVGSKSFFIDLDVIGIGKIVPETAHAFDEYWNSQSVFAIDSFIETIGDINLFLKDVAEVSANEDAITLNKNVQSSAKQLIDGEISLEWTKVQLAYDDPLKGEGKAKKEELLIDRMVKMVGEVTTKLDLVSAYFIPGKKGEAHFSQLSSNGKQVRILTNAMSTTDVLMVHAGYAKYRRPLLESGVELYELKPNENIENLKTKNSSKASLHAKTFAVDDNRIFIGSFNFDPRSIHLNCEMGFLIHSENLAKRLSEAFDVPIKANAYQTLLTPKNKIVWNETKENGDFIIYQEEPRATWAEQITMVIVGWLPVEWLL